MNKKKTKNNLVYEHNPINFNKNSKKLALEIALQFTESRISLTEQAVQTADPDVSEETLNQIYNDYIIRIAYPIMDELTKKYIEELKQI